MEEEDVGSPEDRASDETIIQMAREVREILSNAHIRLTDDHVNYLKFILEGWSAKDIARVREQMLDRYSEIIAGVEAQVSLGSTPQKSLDQLNDIFAGKVAENKLAKDAEDKVQTVQTPAIILKQRAEKIKSAVKQKTVPQKISVDVQTLFENNPDPFTVRRGNNVIQVAQAYRAIKDVPIKNIVDAIIAKPEMAEAFFKRRVGTRIPRLRNFRKELAERPDLIETLIESGERRILSQIGELLTTSHLKDEGVRKSLHSRSNESLYKQSQAPAREATVAIDKADLNDMFMELAKPPQDFDETVFRQIYPQYSMEDLDKLAEQFIKLGSDEYRGDYNANILRNLNKMSNFHEYTQSRAPQEEASSIADTAESSPTSSPESSPRTTSEVELAEPAVQWKGEEHDMYLQLVQEPKYFNARIFNQAFVKDYSQEQLHELSENLSSYDDQEQGGTHKENIVANMEKIVGEKNRLARQDRIIAEQQQAIAQQQQAIAEKEKAVKDAQELDQLLDGLPSSGKPPLSQKELDEVLADPKPKKKIIVINRFEEDEEDSEEYEEIDDDEDDLDEDSPAEPEDLSDMQRIEAEAKARMKDGSVKEEVEKVAETKVSPVHSVEEEAALMRSALDDVLAESPAVQQKNENVSEPKKKTIAVVNKFKEDDDEYDSYEEVDDEDDDVDLDEDASPVELSAEQEVQAYAEEIPEIKKHAQQVLVEVVSSSEMVKGGPTWDQYWKAFDEVQNKFKDMKLDNPIQRFHEMACQKDNILLKIPDLSGIVKELGVMEKGKENDYKAKFMQAAKGKVELLPNREMLQARAEQHQAKMKAETAAQSGDAAKKDEKVASLRDLRRGPK